MQRTAIYLGEDGGMGGYHEKYLIVTLRKDGSVSLRGMQDMSTDEYGTYAPRGKTGLTTLAELRAALRSVLRDIGADSVSTGELGQEFRQIAKAWESQLLADLARELTGDEE